MLADTLISVLLIHEWVIPRRLGCVGWLRRHFFSEGFQNLLIRRWLSSSSNMPDHSLVDPLINHPEPLQTEDSTFTALEIPYNQQAVLFGFAYVRVLASSLLGF